MRAKKRVLIPLALAAFLPWWWAAPDTGPPVAPRAAAPELPTPPRVAPPVVAAPASAPDTATRAVPLPPPEVLQEPDPTLGVVRGHVTITGEAGRRPVVYATHSSGTHAVATDAEGAWALRLREGHWTLHAEVTGDGELFASRPETVGVAEGQHRYLALEVVTGTAAAGPDLALSDLLDGYLVEDLDDRAAAAGLAEGDILLAVEGHPTGELRPDQLRAALRGPEGSSVLVTVLRGDAELRIPVPLRSAEADEGW